MLCAKIRLGHVAFIASHNRRSRLQARRYDSRTTTFSPEGRLYQVEYAMEAISHAGICVGILAKDGIVLAVEKKITSKLLENISSEKMYKVPHLCCLPLFSQADDIFVSTGCMDELNSYSETSCRLPLSLAPRVSPFARD